MSVSKSQADIIFDRANVALARSQKLVASWLPSNNEDDELSKRKTDAELQREEDEIFVAVPEKYDFNILSSSLPCLVVCCSVLMRYSSDLASVPPYRQRKPMPRLDDRTSAQTKSSVNN